MGSQWVPSAELSTTLEALSGRQRRAVLEIVRSEMAGTALTRLLKTPYSCRWCGWVAGQSSEKRDARKAELLAHEETCKRNGRAWRFVCNFSTYYNKWIKDKTFIEALELARSDMTAQVMNAAVVSLQAGTLDAVTEVRRLISQGESETNRLKAAFGLLDRAGVETAPKSTRVMQGEIDVELTEGELNAIEDALRHEAEGGRET